MRDADLDGVHVLVSTRSTSWRSHPLAPVAHVAGVGRALSLCRSRMHQAPA